MTSGVPQGSVLGPILFIYFINDLPDVVKCICKTFADDTKAYSQVSDDVFHETIQESINAMVEWGDKWLSYFNSDKCKVLHLRKSNPKHPYKMFDGTVLKTLESTECEKDLGVYTDPDLNFNEHIKCTIKKSRNICYMIIRVISYKCIDIMLPLFKTLLRPILEYGNSVWSPYKLQDIDDIEDVQRYFTKRIIGLSNMSYEERLSKLKLPSLGYRRLRGDMIQVFKISHNIYDPLTTKSLFTFATDIDSKTRTNGYKIVKVTTNTTSYKNFFTNRVVNVWNSLSHHVVNVDLVNTFKNNLDKHFCNIMYTTRIDYNGL